VEQQRIRGVSYSVFDRLEVQVMLYMDRPSLRSNDVDNRVKDVLDALQGRAGGPKRLRSLSAVVPNDRQIFKLTVEKALPPKQSKGLGFLLVRKHRGGKPS
jgi:Holliday junction resolvase RusA-like endonuclease